jgi:hypothetical protein
MTTAFSISFSLSISGCVHKNSKSINFGKDFSQPTNLGIAHNALTMGFCPSCRFNA